MNRLDTLWRILEFCPPNYKDVTLLRGLNVETKKPRMKSFLELMGLENRLRNHPIIKNTEKFSSIDLLQTSNYSSF